MDACWLPLTREPIPATLRTPEQVARWELEQQGLPCALIQEADWGEEYAVEADGIHGGVTGLLYGAYALLLHTRAGQPLPEGRQRPAHALRMLDHWDNLDGSIERGYAGRSLFFDAGDFAYDPERLRLYARLLASVGVNVLCVNNVNVVPPAHLLIRPELLPKLAEFAALFRPFGIRLMVCIDYASPTYAGLPTADPLDEGVQRWWRQQADAVYAAIPDLCGFLVKADSEHRPGPHTYGRNHAQGANLLARALRPHGGVVVWRCFVYNCRQDWRDTQTDRPMAAYATYAPLEGSFDENVILQIKNGPMDFQVREPISPLLLAMPRTRKALELQLTQEYTGQQIDLYAMQGMWNEVFADLPENAVCAVAAVSNVGADENWTGHPFAQFNLFAYGRTAWQPGRSPAEEARLWARLTYGLSGQPLETLTSLLTDSRSIYEGYTAPLGLGWMVTPNLHYGPNPMGYEYQAWGTYHRADHTAVGVCRTESGTGYLLQYPPALQARYRDPSTCPEELLLFFHRLRYDWRMRDGRTLLQRVYDDKREAVARAREASERLDTLRDALPPEVFAVARERMNRQVFNAREWRDVLCDFFYRLSAIPDEREELGAAKRSRA